MLVDCEGLKKSNVRVGVYCIFNTSNGRRYVGSSNNLWRRFTEHRRHLATGTHHNQFLQNDYVKSGPDSFLFFILQECSKTARILLEQHWLDAVWDNKQQCYNLDSIAGARTTWVASEETKKRMSAAKKGKPTGSCSELRREAIRKARLGKPHLFSAAGKQRMIESKQKTYNVQLVSPDGIVYGPITNLHAFCREHQLDRASMTRLISGKQKRLGQWKLK
jgi:group I intron endonuclease